VRLYKKKKNTDKRGSGEKVDKQNLEWELRFRERRKRAKNNGGEKERGKDARTTRREAMAKKNMKKKPGCKNSFTRN